MRLTRHNLRRAVNVLGIVTWLWVAWIVSGWSREGNRQNYWIEKHLLWPIGIHLSQSGWDRLTAMAPAIEQWLVAVFFLLGVCIVVGTVIPLVMGWAKEPCPGFCGKCDYSLTGNVSGVCPECGTVIGSVRATRIRVRRLLPPLVVSLALAMCGDASTYGELWGPVQVAGALLGGVSIYLGHIAFTAPHAAEKGGDRILLATLLLGGGVLTVLWNLTNLPRLAR